MIFTKNSSYVMHNFIKIQGRLSRTPLDNYYTCGLCCCTEVLRNGNGME